MSHRGRTVRTPERQAAFIRLLRKGNSVGAAAQAIGCARLTMYGWRADDPEFRRQWDEALEFQTEEIESVVYKKALAGDLLACFGWLRAHKPELYHRRMIIAGDPLSPLAVDHQHKVVVDDVGLPVRVTNNVLIRLPPNGRDKREVIDVAKPPPAIDAEADDEAAA
jgi:hypothetical protein